MQIVWEGRCKDDLHKMADWQWERPMSSNRLQKADDDVIKTRTSFKNLELDRYGS